MAARLACIALSLTLTSTLVASCSDPPAATGPASKQKQAKDASAGDDDDDEPSSSSSSSSGAPAAACTTDADCEGDPGPCKQWRCAGHCQAQSLGESCNACNSGAALRVHFYQVSQALAALVDLPDGRHILVDAADTPTRQYCGNACESAHAHLMEKLHEDLGEAPLDLLWISHPHSDHIGGAIEIFQDFAVTHYVDNGRDGTDSQIKYVHSMAKKEATLSVVEPGREDLPLAGSGDLRISALAPAAWLPQCSDDRNDCSILLRIEYCSSSVLFVGDAELDEEAQLDPGAATLLQVGHHGSDTSSSAAFLQAVQPKYAVISSGKEGEGINGSYCHPRASTVSALTDVLGGAGAQTLRAFDGQQSCNENAASGWLDVPASDRLWATARDGDVVLSTTGDGSFVRE